MSTTAVEDEETRLLGSEVNKEDLTSMATLPIAQQFCVVRKALLGVSVSLCVMYPSCCSHEVNMNGVTCVPVNAVQNSRIDLHFQTVNVAFYVKI